MTVENKEGEIKVSVIIVNYNGSDLLDDCLKSMFKHTKNIEFEVIIVDNGSKDGITEIIKKYKNILLIRNNDNKGFGYANNQGLEIASGEYILFLNNDTIFIENSIKQTYDYIKNQEKECLIGCKLLNTDYSFQQSAYKYPSLSTLLISNFLVYKLFPTKKSLNKMYVLSENDIFTREVDVVIGAFMFTKRSALLKLKGFDTRFYFYHEDSDLCFRFNHNVGKVIYFTDTSIIHRGGATTGKNLWFQSKYRSLSQIQFFQKHYKSYYYIISIFTHYIGNIIRTPIFFLFGIITLKKSFLIKAIHSIRVLFYYPYNKFKISK